MSVIEVSVAFTYFGRWARLLSKVGFLLCENFYTSTLGASLIHSQVLFYSLQVLRYTGRNLSALVRVNPGGHATLFPSVEE